MRKKIFPRSGRAAALLVVALLVAAPLPAQRHRRRTTHSRRTRPAATAPARPNAPASRTATTPATPKPVPSATRGATTTRRQTPAPVRGAAASQSVADKDITFDTLLSADAYALYGEIRGFGQQMQPGGLLELLEPLWLIGSAPDELKLALGFLREHAETLTASRVMVAGMPSDASLPQGFVAIELPSVEAARAFAPKLDKFLTSVVPPAPDPASEPANVSMNVNGNMNANVLTGDNPNSNPSRPDEGRAPRRRRARLEAETARPPAPKIPFHITNAGNLVVVSETPFKLASLRAQPDKLLANQPHFKAARGRFSTEPVFVYFDFGVMERQYKQMREAAEAEAARQTAERIAAQAGQPEPTIAAVETGEEVDPAMTPPDVDAPAIDNPQAPEPPAEETEAVEEAAVVAPVVTGEKSATEGSEGNPVSQLTPEEQAAVAEAEAQESGGPDPFSMLLSMGLNFGMGGQQQWPEGLSLAASPEGESLAVRALLFNNAESKGSIIPFFPLFVSGPPVASEAPALLPAETDIYVGLSLDMAQIYEQFVKGIEQTRARQAAYFEESRKREAAEGNAEAADAARLESKEPSYEAQLAALEKLFGFKIKEDLIGSLGNELAVSIPSNWMTGTPTVKVSETTTTGAQTSATQTTPPARPAGPVALISLRDKDTLQRILPRVLLALGMKRPNDAGQNLKQNGIEITNFGRGALAFIDNYLALAADTESIRRVIAAHAGGQTLASTAEFRTATRWQPRPSLGQVYVSGALLKSVFANAKGIAEQSSDAEFKNLLPHFNLDLGPISHAFVNEGDGPLHEVRVPRNLLPMFVAMEAIETKEAPVRYNEADAMNRLTQLYEAEMAFVGPKGQGRFGTADELSAQKLLYKNFFEATDYRIELSVSGNKFEATATPVNYPARGRRSFFIDETGTLRGGNKGGQRATAADDIIK
ncbi:MAG TPA: hypothetical protein VNA19_00660 [Pyrinomonadaceae bacterium]|nr:hypothetical protein [Pyrinomonadaceae bacterium]